MRSKFSKDLIRKIAEGEGLTIKQVENIVYSFFWFTSKTMNEGDRENVEFGEIRLYKFGVFKVKEAKKKFLKLHEKSNRLNKRSSNNITRSSDDQGVQEVVDKRQVAEEGQGSR